LLRSVAPASRQKSQGTYAVCNFVTRNPGIIRKELRMVAASAQQGIQPQAELGPAVLLIQ